MIIQCDSCGTRYRLAEDMLKPGGIRVRCARCQFVFKVSRPFSPVPEPVSTPELPRWEKFADSGGNALKTEVGDGDFPQDQAGPVTGGPSFPSLGDFGAAGEEAGQAFSAAGADLPETDRWGETEESPRQEEASAAAGKGKESSPEEFSLPPALRTPPKAGEPIDLIRRRGPQRSGLSLFTKLVLILFLAVAAFGGGLVGYLYWNGEPIDITRLLERVRGVAPAAPKPAGRIHLTNFDGFFIVNRGAGRLFVIRGLAVNEYPEPRTAISVKAALYDATGKAIAQKTAFCGNVLDDEALRNLPFRKIEEAMKNQFGAEFSNLTTAPGKTIPFMVVFQNVPDKLAEFSVDVHDSRPANAGR
ncbi:MAG: zinc-ribbon domain-containing protein [Deltaproteobacteria bacterium]|nr:zinc-ribbon domain-containing protein [Deltaproteobacteria bacterium]